MAGRKLPALPSLSAKPELADVFYVVDVSDTSESPDGTSKQIDGTFLSLLGGFQSKNNLAASGAPTVTDDSDSGYAVGSLWGFGNNIYKCTSASVGAAVWVEYSQSSSGTYTPTLIGEVSGTMTFPLAPLRWTKVGDIVTISGSVAIGVATGSVGYSTYFTLPDEALPNNDWDDTIYISGSGYMILNEDYITFQILSADDGDNKYGLINFQKDNSLTSFQLFLNMTYSTNN